MINDVEKALSGIKSAWTNMLSAKDKETFDIWNKETRNIESILYQEKHKLYLKFHNISDKPSASSKIEDSERKRLGRPRIYSDAERKTRLQRYQHEYYLSVTKQKRAERRKNDLVL